MKPGEAKTRVQELFQNWKKEDRALLASAELLLKQWYKVKLPCAEEMANAANDLRELCSQIESHFAQEDRIGKLLLEARGDSSIELDSIRLHAERDHLHLTARLRTLVSNLSTLEVSSEAWANFVHDFSLFVDAFDQHEEEEQGNISALLPTSECQ